MAYPPKGYSREEFNARRQARYEKTGDWTLASASSLNLGAPVLNEAGQRLYDSNGRLIRLEDLSPGDRRRATFKDTYSPQRVSGNTVYDESFWAGDTSGGLVLGDEEVDAIGLNTMPAELSEIPTSSSNALRPRTLAAGWHKEIGSNRDPREQRFGRLTVMFRDGTLYNYYDVSYAEWRTFKGSLSKGPMLNRASKSQGYDGFLLSHPHGPADISDVPEEIQRGLQSMAREAQLKYASTNRARAGYKAPDRRRSKPGDAKAVPYVPKSASRRAGLNPSKNRASNPATANRQKKR
jgi:hypothetical protein